MTSLRDIARAQGVAVGPEMLVEEALASADEFGLPGLVLVRGGKVEGVFRYMDLAGLEPRTTLGQLTPTRVSPLAVNESALEALEVMNRERFGLHPLLGADGELIGLVAYNDLLAHISENESPASLAARARPFRILIADDSPVVRKSLEITLGLEGYETVTAADGREAIDQLNSSPDLVLLDTQMPRLDGRHVLSAIRRDPLLSGLPVIMLIPMAELDNRLEAFTLGADDYLIKPYLKRELTARVARLLEARRLAEKAREASRAKEEYLARLKNLTEFNDNVIRQMADGLLVMDLGGNVIKANPAALAILEAGQENNLLGKSILTASPDLGETLKLRREPGQAGITLTSGRVVPIEFVTSALAASDGTSQGVICLFRDLGPLRKTMEALRREQAETLRLSSFLESVLINMNSGLMVTGLDGRINILNRMGAAILGVEKENWRGRLVEEISPALSVFRLAVQPAEQPLETVVKVRGQTDVPIGFTSNYLFDAEGQKTGVITAFKDLTELKEVRQELRTKEKLATIGEMAGGIAHEIKNPLFAVTSAIQILQYDTGLNEDQKATLDIVFRESMRVDRLIKQLLSFTARRSLKLAPNDLALLIKDVLTLHRGSLESKGLRVETRITPNLPLARFDRDLMIQVMHNVLQNAIEASPGDAAIGIEAGLAPGGRFFFVRVKDRGAGIPAELKEKVFDLFFSTKKGNSGIGLAISRKIVLEHGGSIRTEDNPQGGTIVTIEVPAEDGNGKNHPGR